MAVERLLAGRFNDVKIDVRVVGVPAHHDADIDVEELPEAGVDEIDLRERGAVEALEPRQQPVELHERNHLDLFEARPLADNHVIEKKRRAQAVGPSMVAVHPVSECQGEVAKRLRVLPPQAADAVEDLDSPIEFARLAQSPGEHPKQRGVVQLQLGEVREDAEAERLVDGQDRAGAVEEERRAFGVGLPLLEIDGVCPGRCRPLDGLQVRRVWRPRLDRDRRGCGPGLLAGDLHGLVHRGQRTRRRCGPSGLDRHLGRHSAHHASDNPAVRPAGRDVGGRRPP